MQIYDPLTNYQKAFKENPSFLLTLTPPSHTFFLPLRLINLYKLN